MAEKGHHLDLTSSAPPASHTGGAPAESGSAGKFLGVQFMCCDIYSRVYPNRDQTAYDGRCPRCGKRVEFRIGEGGTDARFFQAY